MSSAGNDVDGIYRLIHSDLEGPANTHACVGAGVGNPEYVTVKELVDIVTEVSSKRTNVAWVKGAGWGTEPQFQQRAHLLDRLAGALPAGGRDQAHGSVD